MTDNDSTAGRPEYAIIHVGTLGGDAWPIVERVPGGWQSGAHHYPDDVVLDVELLNPPAPRARSIVALAARVRGARNAGLGALMIADYNMSLAPLAPVMQGNPSVLVVTREQMTAAVKAASGEVTNAHLTKERLVRAMVMAALAVFKVTVTEVKR